MALSVLDCHWVQCSHSLCASFFCSRSTFDSQFLYGLRPITQKGRHQTWLTLIELQPQLLELDRNQSCLFWVSHPLGHWDAIFWITMSLLWSLRHSRWCERRAMWMNQGDNFGNLCDCAESLWCWNMTEMIPKWCSRDYGTILQAISYDEGLIQQCWYNNDQLTLLWLGEIICADAFTLGRKVANDEGTNGESRGASVRTVCERWHVTGDYLGMENHKRITWFNSIEIWHLLFCVIFFRPVILR